MARKKRFPQIRVRRPDPKRSLQAAREVRHGLHAIHHLEHLLAHRQAHAEHIAKSLIAKTIERGPSAGGPLIVSIGVTVNMEDMEDVSQEALEGLEMDIHEIMENTMINTVSEAKSLVPVRTGALRNSISGQVDDEALMVTFRADTGYAIYVEDGTSRMAPDPYLREPAAEAEDDMNDQIDNAITDALDRNVQGGDDGEMISLELETEIEYIV